MPIHKQKLDWCLARETRMKKIKPNGKLADEHINKAKHNLRAADYNIKGVLVIGMFRSPIMRCIIPYLLSCLSLVTNQKIMNAQLTLVNI